MPRRLPPLPSSAAPLPQPRPGRTGAGPDILWIGAHKTGTTFLQKSLELSRPALDEAGLWYPGLDDLRRDWTRPLLYAGHAQAPAPPPPRDPRLPRRLVFDENIAALVQRALGPAGLYPDAPRRARRMARYLGLDVGQVVLGVRGLRTFLPSLYGEALKSTPFRPFRSFLAVPPAALSWAALADRLAAAFPAAQIVVYAAETVRGREGRLLAALTGIPPGAFAILPEAERMGFSHRAIEALHAQAQTRAVTRHDLRRLVRTFPRGPQEPGYAPWSAEEAADLDRRYAEDLRGLAAHPSVRFPDGFGPADP